MKNSTPARDGWARSQQKPTSPVEPPIAQSRDSNPVPMLSAQQRDTVLGSWSGQEHDPSLAPDELLHEIFQAQADRHASDDKVALDCAGERMTYAELERKANQLAQYLRRRGVGRGSFVAIRLPRSNDVYVTLLAILKAGAAYVPMDNDCPPDRVAYILADSSVHTLVTISALADGLATTPAGRPVSGRAATNILQLDLEWDEVVSLPADRLTRQDTATTRQDPCYVIYTSGSTGRPKGVLIEHRSACNLVRVEQRIYGVGPEDRVFQGFSIAFDASVEEVWMAFAAGATLVVGTSETVHAGGAMAPLLTEAAVTVLSTVPTVLSMMDPGAGGGSGGLPTVRLLILGGESCPQALVDRWCPPAPSAKQESDPASAASRRMINTYGPTEATVIATYGDCAAGRPVTIGRPAPNYRVYLLDEQVQPVAIGTIGEICIGGVGVARGYVGRPDLTAEKFVPDPFSDQPGARLYKTGDLGRYTQTGEIEFAGRIDGQVKLRGYRIELSEIEAVLMQCPGVQAAAVAVRQVSEGGEGGAGIGQLVGYVVLRRGWGERRTARSRHNAVHAPLDEDAIRAFLRPRLPAYMIPALVEVVADLPMLASGKVDRNRLPAPRPRQSSGDDFKHEAPRSELEKRIAAVWETLFAPRRVGRSDDFFTDLGGHSLLAAQAVSLLRKAPDLELVAQPPPAVNVAQPTPEAGVPHSSCPVGLAGLSVRDIYSFPTVASLADELQARQQGQPQPSAETIAGSAVAAVGVSPRAHRLCGWTQFLSLYFIVGLFSMQWLAPFLTYSWMWDRGEPVFFSIVVALGILLALYPLMLVVGVAVKWIVIGRYKPGRYRLWGFYYFRWWFVNQILSIVPTDSLEGTPLLAWYCRLMGARIGPNCYLGSAALHSFDLLTIGADTSIGNEAALLGYSVEDGELRIGPITVGQRCFIGARSIVRGDTQMEDDSRLGDLSLLSEGGRIGRGACWLGSPARAIANDQAVPDHGNDRARPNLARRFAFGLLHALAIVILPAVYLLALLPGVTAMNYGQRAWGGYWYMLLSPLVALSFVVLLAIEIPLVKWLMLGRVRPGRYPIYSFFYLRKWFVDQLMDMSLDLLGSLYSTLYLAPWYRLLGAKLGRNAEVSTAAATSPDLLSIGTLSFVADSVTLGFQSVEKGYVTLAKTQVGRRAFVGNSAAIPGGSVIGNDSLIGCLSAPPLTKPGAERPGTTWLGSPAIFLPQRQTSTAFSAQSTFRPTAWLYAQRLVIEYFRVTLPATLFIALTCLLIMAVTELNNSFSLPVMLLWFPVICFLCGVSAALIVVAAKWILMGRYTPAEKPLWSRFVWRTELLTSLHEDLADPFLIDMLTGTPFVCWFFRLLGAHIGRRVYMDSTELTEFDLVRIGDEAMLNDEATLQTHLFEDRVMKMSTVEIGPRCSVGAGSIVLYDTRMEAGACLGDLSLLMKGEVLPAGTRWEGTPARRASQWSGQEGRVTSVERRVDTTAPSSLDTRRSSLDTSAIRLVFRPDQFDPQWAGPQVWVLAGPGSRIESRIGQTTEPAAPSLDSGQWTLDTSSRDQVRRILGRHLGLDPRQVAIDADPHGGLSLNCARMTDCPAKARSLTFNVAHSEDVLVVGVRYGGRIGVDVEVVRDNIDVSAMAGTHFTPEERQQIESLPASDRLTAFYKFWTAKEAILKALGLGLSFGMDQVQLVLENGVARLVRLNSTANLANGWTITHYDLSVAGRPAIGAVATAESG